MNKDEYINKLEQIILRLIYSNWDLKSSKSEGYLYYGPYKLIVKFDNDDVVSAIKNKFLKCINEIEGINYVKGS